MSSMAMPLAGVVLALFLASCDRFSQPTLLPSPPPASAGPGRASSTASGASFTSPVAEYGTGEVPAGAVEPVQQGVSAGSCVETYSPDNVKHRAFAFDGTVTAIELREDPALGGGHEGGAAKLPWVTFRVNQWYKGGSGSEMSVWMQGIQTSDQSLPLVSTGSIPVDTGTRLLVSGEAVGVGSAPEQGIAWSCGFTRPYTPEAAAEWEAPTK